MTHTKKRTTTRRHRAGMIAATGLTALGVLLGAPSDAGAYPRILRPGTRPWVAEIGFGPSIVAAESGIARTYRRKGVQLMLEQQIGGHFQGDAEGPALGATFEEAFLRDYARLSVGCKFWWDIKIIKDLGLYLFPEAKLGMALTTSPLWGFFDMQVGFGGRLMLDDRWMVFLKPISADFLVSTRFLFSWDILAGGGVTW